MVSIQRFIEEDTFNMIEVVAGEKGLHRTVTGLNIVESTDLARFCLPNELLICTGIHLQDKAEELRQLIKMSAHHQCAGLIINVGPYIPSISKEMANLADELQFPLFQMGWQYRIVDLLKNSFHFFMQHQQETMTQEKLLEALITNKMHQLNPEALYTHSQFKETDELGIVVCESNADIFSTIDPIVMKYFTQRYDYFITIPYQQKRIFLISRSYIRTPEIPFARTIRSMMKELQEHAGALSVGMGNFYTDPAQLATSYEEAISVIKLSQSHSNRRLYKYKELGAYKILMAVPDKRLLQTFAQDMLGNLLTYDQLHQSDLIQFLRIFIEEDGQTAAISKREFIHRNTVLYKVKKIETILDVDLSTSFTKTNLALALMILDSL